MDAIQYKIFLTSWMTTGMNKCALIAMAVLLSANSLSAITFVDVQFPGSVSTYPIALDATAVVGLYLDGSGKSHGFRFNGSDYVSIDVPWADETTAYDVEGMKIVGQYRDSGGTHGYLFDGTSFVTIDNPSGFSTRAFGIEANRITGSYTSTSGIHGFVFDGSAFATLDHPSNTPFTSSFTAPLGMQGDKIVGQYADPSATVHAFLFDGITWTTIDHPQAAMPYGTGIQGIDGIELAGYFGDATGKYHAFLYDGTTFRTVDHPLGVNGTFFGGLESGRVVGTYLDAANAAHGFVAIVPEPTSAILVVSGIPGLLAVRRRGGRLIVPATILARLGRILLRSDPKVRLIAPGRWPAAQSQWQ